MNFAIDNILETALIEISTSGVNLLRGERLFGLKYANNIVLMCSDTQTI